MSVKSFESVDAATTILDQAMSKAADALSFFVKQKVSALHVEQYSSVQTMLSEKLSGKEAGLHYYAMRTELLGEIKGVCYLMFSAQEIQELFKVNFTTSILADSTKAILLQEALLLEVDNILSAAAIAVFSDQLKLRMFGGVPHVNTFPSNQLLSTIPSEYLAQESFEGFSVILASENKQIAVEFIWVLESRFFAELKNVGSRSRTINPD